MSPLLTTRAPVSVNLRLAAACAVMVAAAALVAVGGGDAGRPTAAVPAALAAGAVCAAVAAHLLHASVRATQDDRLAWMAAGVTVAFLGLVAALLGQPSLFPDDGGPVTQSADATAARYLIWHAGLLAAAILAVARVPATRGRLVALTAAAALLLLYASLAERPLGELADPFGGYHAGVRVAAAAIAAGLAATAAAWWRTADGAPTWVEVCVIALLALSAGDALAYLFATDPYENAWWASLTLRAGQFAVPAVGMVIGFVAVADRLRDLQDELAANLEAERELARRQEELAGLDRRRRDEAAARIRRLVAGEGLDFALQPIVDLGSRRTVGAEALARFTDRDGAAVPAEDTFLEAHALGLGVQLELAVIRRALASEDRLPGEDMYLALNVSPALLALPVLEEIVTDAQRGGRRIVVELTEHQAVEDYAALGATLDRLRAHGVRVAVDDVGSGFASFRHVTRVKPEILKLDRSLVCGIDEDPVRQSLAGAIVAFATEVGATVVSEGIESADELECLMELAVGCGQGFYIARPAPQVSSGIGTLAGG